MKFSRLIAAAAAGTALIGGLLLGTAATASASDWCGNPHQVQCYGNYPGQGGYPGHGNPGNPGFPGRYHRHERPVITGIHLAACTPPTVVFDFGHDTARLYEVAGPALADGSTAAYNGRDYTITDVTGRWFSVEQGGHVITNEGPAIRDGLATLDCTGFFYTGG